MWNITVDEALARVTVGIARLEAEEVPLHEADGRVLAEDITAPIDLPPFANSAMDGYAVVAADLAGASAERPVRLPVVTRVAAGQGETTAIQPGQVARIMTGAPIPPSADAVVKFEDTLAPSPDEIAFTQPVAPGTNIRQPGEDVTAGQVALQAGMPLSSPALGLLAALGYAAVPCVRRPRVAVISTGDELIPPGQPLTPGKIHDSNGVMLAAHTRQFGGMPAVYGAAGDTQASLHATLARALSQQPDLILTSGGISLGDFDLVKDILRAEGEIDFWQVRMRPGKPLAFGHIAGVPLLGLPGNPVAAYVGAALYARAVLLALQGLDPAPALYDAVCAEPIRNGSGRRNFLRGVAEMRGTQLQVRQIGGQLPTQLAPLARGNCLIVAHEERAMYDEGETVPVLLLASGLQPPLG